MGCDEWGVIGAGVMGAGVIGGVQYYDWQGGITHIQGVITSHPHTFSIHATHLHAV